MGRVGCRVRRVISLVRQGVRRMVDFMGRGVSCMIDPVSRMESRLCCHMRRCMGGLIDCVGGGVGGMVNLVRCALCHLSNRVAYVLRPAYRPGHFATASRHQRVFLDETSFWIDKG